MIYESILETIGQTPLVKLDRLFADHNVTVLLKLELANPGGSHKVRIALNMVTAAEEKGILCPNSGQTILEPTGGNTGIGIAMASIIRGYKVVLVIPDNYSSEKQQLLRALGVEIVLADSTRGNNAHGELAVRLQLQNPDFVMLNQIANPANPAIHRTTTAREILADIGEKTIDWFVAGTGTGGHLTGVGEILSKRFSALETFMVEPEGCDMFSGAYVKHCIQGLSVGMIPPILNTDLIHETIHVSEFDAITGMKNLMRKEGIYAGPSTGANIAAIFKLLEQKQPSKSMNVLTFAYDNAHDYLGLLESST